VDEAVIQLSAFALVCLILAAFALGFGAAAAAFWAVERDARAEAKRPGAGPPSPPRGGT
jgi:ABC-type uncharacterized transport system permease subunit